jgi:hypothetical protein
VADSRRAFHRSLDGGTPRVDGWPLTGLGSTPTPRATGVQGLDRSPWMGLMGACSVLCRGPLTGAADRRAGVRDSGPGLESESAPGRSRPPRREGRTPADPPRRGVSGSSRTRRRAGYQRGLGPAAGRRRRTATVEPRRVGGDCRQEALIEPPLGAVTLAPPTRPAAAVWARALRVRKALRRAGPP